MEKEGEEIEEAEEEAAQFSAIPNKLEGESTQLRFYKPFSDLFYLDSFSSGLGIA